MLTAKYTYWETDLRETEKWKREIFSQAFQLRDKIPTQTGQAAMN